MWEWVLIWVLIALVGGLWLVLLGREVLRKGRRLLDEIEAASAVLEAAGTAPSGAPAGDAPGAPDDPGPRGRTMAVRDLRR